ncbi:hypothetical protein [Streptomyces buecherae]
MTHEPPQTTAQDTPPAPAPPGQQAAPVVAAESALATDPAPLPPPTAPAP